MPFWYPSSDEPRDEAWWHPLREFALIVAFDPLLPLVVPCEFMMMGRVDRKARPNIWLYKHVDTRAYLNIDDALQPYRFVAPPLDSDRNGRYVKEKGGIRRAVRRLGLWEFDRPDSERCDCDFAQRVVSIRAGMQPGRFDDAEPLGSFDDWN